MLVSLCVAALMAQTVDRPVRAVTDPGVITTRQAITPAGVPAVFNSRVYGVDFGQSAEELWVLTATHLYRVDWRQNRVLEQAATGGAPGLQSLRWDAAGSRVLAATSKDRKQVRLGSVARAQYQTLEENLGRVLSGSMAIASKPDAQGRRIVAVPLIYDNELAIANAETGKLIGRIKTGIAPFAAVLDDTGSVAWVSNWGGRVPAADARTAPLGYNPNADRVLVDTRGAASSGTISRIDLKTMAVTHTVSVDPHPNALAWDTRRERLYVASSNRDSVTVVDSKTMQPVRTWSIQPFAQKVTGIAPTAAALSTDGTRLYVTCGGVNAIAVLDTASGKILGLIPTAWYPSSVNLSRDGKYLAVGSLLGAGSGWREEPRKRFVHSNRGAVSVIAIPDAAQLAVFTAAVSENNHMNSGASLPPDRTRPAAAVPLRAGEASLIENVVFIIKENRTYDQVLGDLKQGNGDPSLVMFGEDVTPNQHRLAEQFVLLDNFYATGGNSADGHQWVTQANQNAYAMWPGFTGRSYPFDGSDPLAISQSPFLWDAALSRGRTVRIFGEYAGVSRVPVTERHALLDAWKRGESFSSRWQTTAPIASMNKVLAANFPAYSVAIPDVVRSRIFLEHLKEWEQAGAMPNLVMVQLPSNHTSGTLAGMSTAKAMVADNDLALGQIVEGLSRSSFWKKMAILVVEDDAQNGVDHVDGHRTVALAISPYVRRKSIDSTFYSHQSMLKTIELMLGLPALSLFDLIANDMRASFTNTADATPFEAVTPAQSLFERNPAVRALRGEALKAARASAKMNFQHPDAAPTERLNRILWGSVRGWTVPYPGVRQAVFAPLSLDIDDDDR